MEYPKFLCKGDTVGLVAPSFGCSFEPYASRLDFAIEKLEENGYYVNLGPNCRIGEGIGISNVPSKCAEELEEYYVNPDVDFVWSVGGGELMCETISELDFVKLKNSRPKWYMGYSDNTNFAFLSATMLDRAAIYGPCVSNIGRNPWHECIYDAMDVITGKRLKVHNYDKYEIDSLSDEEKPLEPYNCTENVDIKCYVMSTDDGYVNNGDLVCTNYVNKIMSTDCDCDDGCLVNAMSVDYDCNSGCMGNAMSADYDCNDDRMADVMSTDKKYVNGVMSTECYDETCVMSTDKASFAGRLLGGCLDIVTNIVGTRFDYVNQFNEKYKDDGVIWFLEACDLNLFDIRRALWHMDEAGWFDCAKGFIFGRPIHGEDMFNLNEVKACLQHTLLSHNVPVIMGADIGHVPPMMTLIEGAYSKVDFSNGKLVIDMSCEL